MAPAWDELAKEVDGDKSLSTTIAKVDCTKHQSVCQEQGVGGYPTIMFFRGGEKVENYRGGRYVNITSQSNSFSHRIKIAYNLSMHL